MTLLSDDPAGGRAAFGIDVPSGDGHFSSGQNQIVSSDGLPPAPSLPVLSAFSNSIQMCVVCNYHMDTFWDWLPMCKFCYQTACSYRDRYRARITGNASALQGQARAQLQALARAQQAQARDQVWAQARAQQAQLQAQLASGQPSSSGSASSQPAAANARLCGHLHGSDQVCPRCNRGG
ncbi:uncharacterized protein LOC123399081 isoform X2 [Hordeum vulgare subsp. vulgare]|uniref:uncharacterized protein LOC123399081 isoform X2 n=1 Tax=Hordeum vulgare subsp. vulgare TaxID=112509 RepID=UPI001D1A3637|nr:uncharacterized protein LOC123399081 isoform X2 [Hordeum vulgare subsp. vulgare]